jgi:hypothetical protein
MRKWLYGFSGSGFPLISGYHRSNQLIDILQYRLCTQTSYNNNMFQKSHLCGFVLVICSVAIKENNFFIALKVIASVLN